MTKNEATPANPFSKDDMSINMGIVVDMIEKVVKTPPLKTGDTGRFHIIFKDDNTTQTIVLTAAQLLDGPGKFTTLFFDVFGQILFASKKEWPTFALHIAQIAVPGKPDETAAVMAGNLLFENIANTMEVTTDKTYIGKRAGCNRLVEHSPHSEIWYVLPSAAVSELITELPIKANHEDISQAMTAGGLKKANTGPVKPAGGKSIRCWWFSSDKLKEINPDMGVSK